MFRAIATMDGGVFTMRAKTIFLIVLAVSFTIAIKQEKIRENDGAISI